MRSFVHALQQEFPVNLKNGVKSTPILLVAICEMICIWRAPSRYEKILSVRLRDGSFPIRGSTRLEEVFSGLLD